MHIINAFYLLLLSDGLCTEKKIFYDYLTFLMNCSDNSLWLCLIQCFMNVYVLQVALQRHMWNLQKCFKSSWIIYPSYYRQNAILLFSIRTTVRITWETRFTDSSTNWKSSYTRAQDVPHAILIVRRLQLYLAGTFHIYA